MKLNEKRIALLIESDYYEPEIAYYQHRFAEENAELHLLSRLPVGSPNRSARSLRRPVADVAVTTRRRPG